jgi:hydroxyacid-oxoacid transhydrogenase
MARYRSDMTRVQYPAHDTVFTWAAPALKIGLGAVDETGYELARRGADRALIVTDAGIAATGWPERIAENARTHGVECLIYDGVHVEPTDASVLAALDFARAAGRWDAIVALGGGSAIDTAKAVNLLANNPGELVDYLNAPVGKALAPTNPLRPMIAIPTTAGTGSECTAMSILDVLELQVKTGISHPALRPELAIVDPQLTVSMPTSVTAACGMDVLCHAVESLTARPYTAVPRKSAEERVVYCGGNPISDIWTEQAIVALRRSLRAAVWNGDDLAVRTDVMLAATYAGMGFGNAGVHIPHANAYPIAGRVREYHPDGYPGDEPLVPHGQAVSLTAPASFRFTFAAAPDRHLHAARLLDPGRQAPSDAEMLPAALIALMRDIGIPSGIGAVGFTEDDLDPLVEGALTQRRLLAQAPKQPAAADLRAIFADSLANW